MPRGHTMSRRRTPRTDRTFTLQVTFKMAPDATFGHAIAELNRIMSHAGHGNAIVTTPPATGATVFPLNEPKTIYENLFCRVTVTRTAGGWEVRRSGGSSMTGHKPDFHLQEFKNVDTEAEAFQCAEDLWEARFT